MDFLMLDMFQMKQTQMYVCTLEEFILVVVLTLLYKWNEILNGIYIGLYTNIWIDWRTYENDSQMYWSE